MVAAWASRNAEKTQVSSVNPPSLVTIDGVAVATMLISIAVRNIASITDAMMTRRLACGAGCVAAGARAGSAGGGVPGGSESRRSARSVSAIDHARISHTLLLTVIWRRTEAPVYHRNVAPDGELGQRRRSPALGP